MLVSSVKQLLASYIIIELSLVCLCSFDVCTDCFLLCHSPGHGAFIKHLFLSQVNILQTEKKKITLQSSTKKETVKSKNSLTLYSV